MEWYKLWLNDNDIKYFPKHYEDKDKYLVFTCAKNENEYIREWIQHYLDLNFDKIIICDNNDDESLVNVISDYIENGVVEIFDCRGLDSFQVQIYSMFCSEGNYRWCAFFDCDEFLELNLYNDIKEYLNTKEDEVCISFNWMIYGSNGMLHKENGLVQERFALPVSPISLFIENCYIKSIVKGGVNTFSDCWFNGSHMPLTKPMYKHCIGGYFWKDNDSHQILPPRYKEGYIKHYYTKSFEEWTHKAQRGWPDGTPNLNMYKFFVCDDWGELPINNMTNSLFVDKLTTNYSELLNRYDVFLLLNEGCYIGGFLVQAFHIMKQTTQHTFVFGGDHIDDTTFNIIFEYALKTGNRAVWANSYDDVWMAYLKYNKGKNDTYYILHLD